MDATKILQIILQNYDNDIKNDKIQLLLQPMLQMKCIMLQKFYKFATRML